MNTRRLSGRSIASEIVHLREMVAFLRVEKNFERELI